MPDLENPVRLFSCMAVAGAVLGLLVFPGPASAHTGLRTSTPVDGQTVRRTLTSVDLVFWSDISEPVIHVTDPEGGVIDGHTRKLDDMTARFDMPPLSVEGVYEVRYESISNDGDITTGEISFSYAPDPTSGRNGLRGAIIGVLLLMGISTGVWIALAPGRLRHSQAHPMIARAVMFARRGMCRGRLAGLLRPAAQSARAKDAGRGHGDGLITPVRRERDDVS